MFRKLFVFLCIGVICAGISCKKPIVKNEEDNNKEATMGVEQKQWKAPVKEGVEKGKKYIATIKTSKGDIVCELFAEDAPLSVTNFKYLADSGFYKGLTFHRVVPDFVIQGGDPDGTGAGGPGYTIPAEIGKPHKMGALAWARTGDEVNPERRSSGSQFYITYKATPFLDGAYTVFGQTIQGMDVVNKIEQGDKIADVLVEAR